MMSSGCSVQARNPELLPLKRRNEHCMERNWNGSEGRKEEDRVLLHEDGGKNGVIFALLLF